MFKCAVFGYSTFVTQRNKVLAVGWGSSQRRTIVDQFH